MCNLGSGLRCSDPPPKIYFTKCKTNKNEPQDSIACVSTFFANRKDRKLFVVCDVIKDKNGKPDKQQVSFFSSFTKPNPPSPKELCDLTRKTQLKREISGIRDRGTVFRKLRRSVRKCGNTKKLKKIKTVIKVADGAECHKYDRYVDKSNDRNFYECEVQHDGLMLLRLKHCPGGELFSKKYKECVQSSFMQISERLRRFAQEKDQESDEFSPKDGVKPNDWMEPPNDGYNNLPAFFKPKPRNKLRIYHLRSKRRHARTTA